MVGILIGIISALSGFVTPRARTKRAFPFDIIVIHWPMRGLGLHLNTVTRSRALIQLILWPLRASAAARVLATGSRLLTSSQRRFESEN